MTEKTTTNREALIRVTNLVRPALATQAYLPALTMICFDGHYATAYNDISAISVRASVDLARCLPGELLIKALGSFGAEQIVFQEDGDPSLVLSSGRSKIKLPTQSIKDFPFTRPAASGADELVLDPAILKGIAMCLISVGNDPTHPAQMGVTLDVDNKGLAILFSTDNFTISRYQTKTKIKLPGDTPVILPRFFCEQLVLLAKAFPDSEIVLLLHAGALEVEFGDNARLFTKTPVDLEPLDFPKIIEKHCKLAALKERLAPIPDSFDASLSRALLVLSGEMDKAARLTVKEGMIRMHASSALGDSDDSMPFKGEELDAPAEPFFVDPALVVRASKVCGLLGFTEKVLILADPDVQFVHFVAHCSK